VPLLKMMELCGHGAAMAMGDWVIIPQPADLPLFRLWLVEVHGKYCRVAVVIPPPLKTMVAYGYGVIISMLIWATIQVLLDLVQSRR
jgi:hypothetical protein